MDERIKQIADLYGLKHQCIKCTEEMAELAAEIARYIGSGVPDGARYIPYNLECELADVIIMVEQLKYLVNTAFVEQEIERKLERQLQRMEEASGIPEV